MASDIHIPAAALDKGIDELEVYFQGYRREIVGEIVSAAFLAIVQAWPGMWVLNQNDEDYIPPRHDLILPLHQQEKQDG